MSHTSIEELLGTNKYEVDPDEAHIVVDKAACARCFPKAAHASRHARQAYSRSSVEQWRSTMQVALNVGLVALSVGKRQSRGTIPGAVRCRVPVQLNRRREVGVAVFLAAGDGGKGKWTGKLSIRRS